MSTPALRLAFPLLAAALAAAARADQLGTVEEAELLSTSSAPGEALGSSAALSGDTAVLGAPLADPGGLADAGLARVFVRGATGWSEQAELVAADGAAGDELGVAVAVDGDTLALGAWQDDDGGAGSGSVYVFVRSGTAWTQQAKLVAPDAAAGDGFGRSVALRGERLLVGAPGDDDMGADSGSAYVFARAGTVWSQQQKLVAPDGLAGDAFGTAVDLDPETLLVGSPLDDTTAGVDKGSAYVFTDPGMAGSFSFQAKLKENGPALGTVLDLDGDRALLGGPNRAVLFTGASAAWTHVETFALGISAVALGDDGAVLLGRGNEAAQAGVVRVLRLVGSAWRLQQRLGGAASGDHFGHALAASSGRVLVGSPQADAAGVDAGGAVALRLGPWLVCRTEAATLFAPDPGRAVSALQGDLLAVGRPDAGTERVTVFRLEAGAWTQEAELTADDATPDDDFGYAVALDGDTLAVGAPEDQPGGLFRAGSVYVLERAGTSWSQAAKLTASDAAALARFGAAVSLDGDTLVVGTCSDVATSTYVFSRSGSTWNQDAVIPVSGCSVAVSGDTIAIARVYDGTVHVRRGSGASWPQEAIFAVPSGEEMPIGVALHGDLLAVGVPQDGVLGTWTGSVRAYTRSGTTWTQAALLVAPDGADRTFFGRSVATDGRTILATTGSDGWTGDAAYAFAGAGSAWTFQQKLLSGDGFGLDAVDVDGDHAVGGRYVFDLSGTFPSFCDASDGALASCPCGNAGDPDSGCDLPQGTGGVRLDVLAQRFLPLNRATLGGTGFPPGGVPTVVAVRAAALDTASPVVFGDGLRCVGVPLLRLGATFATAGSSVTPIGHAAMAGAGTFYYQLWFRSVPIMFCDPSAAFNLSNGRSLSW
jgi:FG-GAP repeat